MRQTSLAMDAGEWDTWLQEMDAGHGEVTTPDLASLRSTCTVRAVHQILDSAPGFSLVRLFAKFLQLKRRFLVGLKM